MEIFPLLNFLNSLKIKKKNSCNLVNQILKNPSISSKLKLLVEGSYFLPGICGLCRDRPYWGLCFFLFS